MLDGVSNHQPYDCLLNHLFRRRSKEASKLRVTGLCEGNSPVTGEFPAQRASNEENVSIWWSHHENGSGSEALPQSCQRSETQWVAPSTLVRNKVFDQSDVVGASPAGIAPTTSPFSTEHLVSMEWQRQLWGKMRNSLVLGFGAPYIRG